MLLQADKRDLCLESLILWSSVAQNAWSERSFLPHANVAARVALLTPTEWLPWQASAKLFPSYLGATFRRPSTSSPYCAFSCHFKVH